MGKIDKELVEKLMNALATKFINGYILGSCVSLFEAGEIFKEELEDKGIILSNDEIEDYLTYLLDNMEIFRCENCGWWCCEHDRSSEGTYCSDCDPDEEE